MLSHIMGRPLWITFDHAFPRATTTRTKMGYEWIALAERHSPVEPGAEPDTAAATTEGCRHRTSAPSPVDTAGSTALTGGFHWPPRRAEQGNHDRSEGDRAGRA